VAVDEAETELKEFTDKKVQEYKDAIGSKLTLNIGGRDIELSVHGNSDGVDDFRDNFARHDPRYIVDKLLEGLTENTKFDAGYVSFDKNKFQFSLYGADGLSMTLTSDGSRKKAALDAVEFSESLQGKGMSKTLIRNTIDVLNRRLGISQIDVQAAKGVGGYTWCKYGFKVNEKDWKDLSKQVSKHLEKVDGLPDLRMNLVKSLLATPDAKKFWTLSEFDDKIKLEGKDTTLGKALLLETTWEGVLDFNDAESVNRTFNYVNRR
jgi:hypothetical protein